MHKTKGFTLIEAMIVVAIMGILSAIAYPSFRSSIDNAQVRRAVGAIEDALDRARIAAIESNNRITVCPVADRTTRQCIGGSDWSNGLLVFEDDNGNSDVDTGERLVGFFEIESRSVNVRINGKMDFVRFLGGGSRAEFSNGNPGTIEVTSTTAGSKLKKCLMLNRLGRVVRNESC